MITAGPTWVPIDKVRVISNIASGTTGVLLARGLSGLGARVTLLLGPVDCNSFGRKVRVRRFRFFEELKSFLSQELNSGRYDIIIHSAAVSDYRPKRVLKQKISSGIKSLKLELVPTAKIINLVKRINRKLFLVGFKFEVGAGYGLLVSRARQLIKCSRLDLAVANTLDRNRYRAYIVTSKGCLGPFRGKKGLVQKLISVIGESYG